MQQKFTCTPMGEMPFYVYTLSYPKGFVDENGEDLSDIVFYVGRGTVTRTSSQRIDMHEQDTKSSRSKSNPRKIAVIRKIHAAGMNIQKRVIFESDNRLEVRAHEEICLKKTYAGPYLTNVLGCKNPDAMPYTLLLEKQR